jgi:hypothetical protein
MQVCIVLEITLMMLEKTVDIVQDETLARCYAQYVHLFFKMQCHVEPKRQTCGMKTPRLANYANAEYNRKLKKPPRCRHETPC